MRWGLLLVTLLAACEGAQSVPEAGPPGQPYVEFGDGGAFSGATSFRIMADGRWTASSSQPFGPAVTRADDAGPAAYAATRDAALRGIAALGPVSSEACPDYGTDFVVVSDGVAPVAEAFASCPGSGVVALITTLRQTFSDAAAR